MSKTLFTLSAQSLPDSIDNRTKAYCGAALAAGVSILALTAPSEASVVVTKTHQTIPLNGRISIDLNKDGVTDFNVKMSNYFDFSFRDSVRVIPTAGGGVVGYNGGIGPYASALAPGANIGPSAHFRVGTYGVIVERSTGEEFSTHTTRNLYGKWGGDPQNRYVGVKFQIQGKTHYGWIRMTVNTDLPANMSATISAYAYETVANKTIKAGNTKSSATATSSRVTEKFAVPDGGSLGMLALGSEGLQLWRREKTSAA